VVDDTPKDDVRTDEPGPTAEADQGGGEQKPRKKFSMPRLPKKALVMGAGALVIVVGSYFLVSGILRPNLNKLAVEREAEASHKELADKAAPSEHEVGHTYAIENVLVNPNEPGARRFLRVGLAFEADSEAALEELQAREMQIRDLVITLYSSRTLAELTDPILKQHARKQLVKQVNEKLTTGKLMNIYYTDYVIQ
jgi:flagellar FliL protein